MRSPAVQSVKRDLQELKASDFASLALALKDGRISSLELSIGRNAEPRFTFLSPRHADAMFNFSRALAWSVSSGGWLQHLELGFSLCKRDLQLLVHALCLSKTLKHLSFANSGLGDSNLHLLARGFRDCASLQVLCLAGCNLTDAVAPVLASILKVCDLFIPFYGFLPFSLSCLVMRQANLSRKIQEDWQNSLRVYRQMPGRSVNRCGLRVLDLSWNILTVASVREMCTIFRLGPSIEALDVRGNNLDLESQKLLNDVMSEWGILKFVDLRESGKSSLLGVLEKGQYATESRFPVSTKSPTRHYSRKWKRKSWPSRKELTGQGVCIAKAKRVSDAERYSLGTRTNSLLSNTKLASQSLLSSLETAPFSPVTPVTPSSLNLEPSSWNHDDQDGNRCISCSTSTDDLRWSTAERPVGYSSDATSTDDLQHFSCAPARKLVEFKDDPTSTKSNNAEWNGFLTDIGKALLQLNDRLDRLIGPCGESDNLRIQLSALV
ncbi:centrosomal protein of 78 kDa-like isoform X1 [Selaginella moellendorffii]|uniref:centrosomal protein of 78 kDa-like isoform X1 n=1 Tax=Selaginella moellendorffii TaxID=88036 RepID=UPI000D1CEE21|nr:centrosomal protein of 78 kDa-like isoform X1 [Selaginella moellendorffii]|eukprot:XP_024519233.1 centrosomal protein of 78 kDa-like isoform X1 [Selaginella moellendorffii]